MPMIIGEVRRYLRDNNSIRVSRSVRDLAYKALSIKEALTRKNGKEPTIEEILNKVNEGDCKVKKEDLTEALEAIADPVSLYEPVYNDSSNKDSMYVMDQISDTSNTDEMWLEEIALKQALKRLNSREKNIISMRFFRGKTQMEIAAEIGISQAQVSRLEKSALERIKKYM